MESTEFNQEAYDRYLFDEEKYSDEDFALLMAVIEKYQEILEEADDDDFEVNPPQYQKFIALCAYFMKLVRAYGGYIEDTQLSPRMECGDITVFIPILYLECEEVEQFCTALSYCSTFTIDAGDNGKFCLSVTVPDVFKEKGEPVRSMRETRPSLGDEKVGEEASYVLSKFHADIRQILEAGEYHVVKAVYENLQRATVFFAAQKAIDDSYGIEGTEILPVNLLVEMGSAQLTAEFITFQPMDDVSYKEFLEVTRTASSLQIYLQPDRMHISIELTFDGLFEAI